MMKRFKRLPKQKPNFQGILNWIAKILHCYCRKQHKKYWKLMDYWTKYCSLFAILSVYCNLCFLLPFSMADFFISWTQYSRNFKCHKWSFVSCIVSISVLKMAFTKLGQLDGNTCIKNCVYNNFNLRYLVSSVTECLPRSFSFINYSLQI